MQRTIVYIDGFNLYYGCIKGGPDRWLDLFRFAKAVLPKNDVVRVKYFTALVMPTSGDRSKTTRQQTYLRALATIPEIEIFLGSFQAHPVRRPLADGSGPVTVIDMKEKGSDVNLATELLVDAFEGHFEAAAVVSNDSDLVAPIRAVQARVNRPVGIINPHQHPSAELRKCCSFYKEIRQWHLAKSLLPEALIDAHGEIHKPTAW